MWSVEGQYHWVCQPSQQHLHDRLEMAVDPFSAKYLHSADHPLTLNAHTILKTLIVLLRSLESKCKLCLKCAYMIWSQCSLKKDDTEQIERICQHFLRCSGFLIAVTLVWEQISPSDSTLCNPDVRHSNIFLLRNLGIVYPYILISNAETSVERKDVGYAIRLVRILHIIKL